MEDSTPVNREIPSVVVFQTTSVITPTLLGNKEMKLNKSLTEDLVANREPGFMRFPSLS